MMTQQEVLYKFAQNILKPKPILSGTEWSNKYFNLSAESSSAPGRFTAYPYQEEILNCMTDLKCKIVVVKKPVRVGYTKLLNATQAFFIHQRQSNILNYQPTDAEARGYAEDEIEPMIRDNPEIAKLVETPNIRGRVKKEKTVKKHYPGGYLEILGSESDRNLNRRTSQCVIGDEIDTWKKEAGKAGDTISTMMRRSSDFYYRKNIIGGKPIGKAYEDGNDVEDGISMVDYWYKRGDMRERWLPCPKCSHFHNFDFIDMEWDKTKDNEGKTIIHHFETAHFICTNCNYKILDKDKRDMDKKGKWIAKKPFKGIASFSFWAILSNSPNVKWSDIAEEFVLSSKNKLKKKAFYNEVLAKTWEEDTVKLDTSTFTDRLEEYEAQVPKEVMVLTMGADVQKDRIEVEVVGWGAFYESWAIEYKVFFGDPTQPAIWESVKGFITKTFVHESGNLMRIHAGAIDAGYLQTTVTDFCKPLFGIRIFATKGAKGIDAPIIPRTPTKTKEKKAPLFLIGINKSKDDISQHIESTGGAGYMHFPNNKGYDNTYFKQLEAEHKTPIGRWVNPAGKRNEAFDVRNYAYIAIFLGAIDLELTVLRGGLFYTGSQTRQVKQRRVLSR